MFIKNFQLVVNKIKEFGVYYIKQLKEVRMANKSPTARILLAGNLGYLENLITQYGGSTPIEQIYQKEKEKQNDKR